MQNPINSDIIIDRTHLSRNQNPRIFSLVLHYTALDFETSLHVLTDPERQVSAHYLVPEKAIEQQRKVFQLVDERQRAWHAGQSYWQGRSPINDTSVGIEIVNLGYKDELRKRVYYPFTDYQIETIVKLAKPIIERYEIHPTCVIGHSDCAPGRKVDPGPLFPWKTLHENGIGAWFDEDKIEIKHHFNNNRDIQQLQSDLRRYGYGIELTGTLDDQTCTVLKAFQMHFRPNDFSGQPDSETYTLLKNLLQKYASSL